jgi:predicted ATPase/DNA-binding XRE family transcriptional regulator
MTKGYCPPRAHHPRAHRVAKTVNCVSRHIALDCEQPKHGVDRDSPESQRGPAMPDDVPSDALTFGDLLRRHRRARALTQEALAERAGVSARAVSDLERGARSHPYRETARLLADALGLTGNARTGLLAAARRSLPPEGMSPPSVRKTRLPRPLTRLIGRDAERCKIAGLLRDEGIRLLTLTGPGGVGKTRLAMAVAADLSAAFRDGSVFVDLAPLQDPALVDSAIAAALELKVQAGISPIEAVQRRLSTRQLLLVLDNFEHLLSAALLVSELLQAAPEVQILVTSRAALRLHGEREYLLSPLPTPEIGVTQALAELAMWDAITLFVERACAVQPGFQLTNENAADVAAICRRLDGLPLAIELAAARVKLLAPATIVDRLERRFPVLTSGTRDGPPRQRTLQAAIAWSYDLLDPHQQALLRCLAVFVGGWTLEAAEAIGSLCGVPDVLDALAALVEHSLVVRDDGRPVLRYHLLETIRAFALDRLVAAGVEQDARRAHVHYLLQLARENDLERLDADVGTRLDRLKAEEANLRTGIAWALDHDPESALAVLAELDYYWQLANREVVGRDLLERAIRTGAGANRLERARVLQQAAWLATMVGDHAQAEPFAEAARVLAAQVGDTQTIAHVQLCQGDLATSRGDIDLAREEFDLALAQFESLGDLWGMVLCLTVYGAAEHDWGDATTAATCRKRVGAIVVAHDLPSFYQVWSLVNLADAYHQLGQSDAALEACRAAMQHAQDVENPSSLAWVRHTLARLLLERGETAHALAHSAELAESLGVWWETGGTWMIVDTLELAAALMGLADQAECAARSLGAASTLRAAMPRLTSVGEREMLERDRGAITAMLGEPAFTQAWTVGQEQSLTRTVAEARAVLASLARGRVRVAR